MSRKLQVALDYDCQLESHLKDSYPEIASFRIKSRSLDARGAPRGKKPRYNYTIEYELDDVDCKPFPKLGALDQAPIIVGAGPAGLFCALRLSEYGIPSVIVERGDCAQKRMAKIARFWRYGELDQDSNVCFGEGGAGLFSDGKLITRIKSPFIPYVMQRLVDFGAPAETAYRNDPHLGSNMIRDLIGKVGGYLAASGCQIRYNTKMERLLVKQGKIEGIELESGEKIYSSNVILATGHSASDVYRYLEQRGIDIRAKDFAVGVRIEHPRRLIDQLQYGKFADDPLLETAKYRLSYHHRDSDRGCYSFCMCPGGYVLSAGTEVDGLVTNGMSNFARNSPWSNAALVVSIKAGIDFQGCLGGIKFQRSIEQKAYNYSKEYAGGKELPAQRVSDFLDGKKGSKLPKTSTPSRAFIHNIDQILPSMVCEHLRIGLDNFNKKIPGLITPQAVVYAPETRTSAPVTIERDRKTLQSPSLTGLYPCGEGAGFAGGITSAAVDGIRVAMNIIESEKDYKL